MKKKFTAACLMAAVMGTATMSFGAGFKVSEQSAKATGMANAFAAQADDPSALAYNPAGIAFQKGTQVQVGSNTILVPQTQFDGTTRLSPTTPVSVQANRDIFLSPTFYATTSMESLPLSFGLGINAFYPLAKRWDADSPFRDSIQSISIKPINFQPTVAYRFDDLKLAVAAGADITYAQVSLQKMLFAVPGVLASELGVLGADATATGFGYNLGLQWKPCSTVSLGAAYRSQIKLNLKGQANYLATTATGQGAVGLVPGGSAKAANTSASTDVTLPDTITMGVAWKPIDKLTLEFDAERTGWSSYGSLTLNFGTPLTAFNNKPDPKNWSDVWAYRLGAQYALTPNVDLRAGYAYDTNPAPDDTVSPELPDSDRHNVTFGTGFHNAMGSIDLAYMWIHWADRTVANVKETGTFKSDAHLIAASATLKF